MFYSNIFIKITFLTGRNYHINKFIYTIKVNKVNLANLYEYFPPNCASLYFNKYITKNNIKEGF